MEAASGSYYFGTLTRAEAEQWLSGSGQSVLLVRESSVPGHFALSRFDSLQRIFGHELIAPVSGGFVIKDSPYDKAVYASVDELIRLSPECAPFAPLGRFVKSPAAATVATTSIPSPTLPRAPLRSPPPRRSTAAGSAPPQAAQLNPLWYYGDIARQETETLLASWNQSTFLVRTSSVANYYALSRYDRATATFSHQLIAPVEGGYKIEECPYDLNTYPSVGDLVQRSPECTSFVPVGQLVNPPQVAPRPPQVDQRGRSKTGNPSFAPRETQAPHRALSPPPAIRHSPPAVIPPFSAAPNVSSAPLIPPRDLESKISSSTLLERNDQGTLESHKERKRREKEEKERKKREELLRKKQEKDSKRGKSQIGKVIEGPTNIQHVSHIGFDTNNGFQIRNIPKDWRTLFQSAGVKKSDLQNPETATFIMGTIADVLSGQPRQPPPVPLQPPLPLQQPPSPQKPLSPRAPPPIPPHPSSPPIISLPGGPPPPLPSRPQSSAPSTFAPPLPPRSTSQPALLTPPILPDRGQPTDSTERGYAQAPFVPPPPAPPVFTPPEAVPSNPLLSQLVNAQLKAVEKGSLPPLEESQQKTLLDTLSNAMIQRRVNIKEDEAGEESDDEGWDDWE